MASIRNIIGIFSLATAFLMPPAVSHALVVDNNSLNITAPPDGAPWSNVGTVNGASGVYLGNGWVLTADHVGAGSVTFGTEVFAFDGLSVRLTNPSDGTPADLLMFHLSSLPALPSLTLASATPADGAVVDMIGYGFNRDAGIQSYPGGMTGYDWSSSREKSWGTNRINTPLIVTADEGHGKVSAFSTSFTHTGPLATAFEAQGAGGDSGGGVFYFDGSGWVLAGVMSQVTAFEGQPPETAVFGNQTLSADIATYRSQIQTTLPIPEPSAAWLMSAGLLVLLATRGVRRLRQSH